jgi:hypothetical protein
VHEVRDFARSADGIPPALGAFCLRPNACFCLRDICSRIPVVDAFVLLMLNKFSVLHVRLSDYCILVELSLCHEVMISRCMVSGKGGNELEACRHGY